MFLGAEGLVALAFLAFWIWALFDSISTDSAQCRNLPKVVWVIIVLLFTVIGALAWVLLGRPQRSSSRPGSTDYSAPRRPVGIEDSPRYTEVAGDVSDRRSAELDKRLDEWEAQQRANGGATPSPSSRSDLDAWEAELAEREDTLRRRELELDERDRGPDES